MSGTVLVGEDTVHTIAMLYQQAELPRAYTLSCVSKRLTKVLPLFFSALPIRLPKNIFWQYSSAIVLIVCSNSYSISWSYGGALLCKLLMSTTVALFEN
jgi:hypothetical protein